MSRRDRRTRVVYFAAEYPRATDTFIQREIAAVRAAGPEVSSSAIRRPGEEHMVGPEQRAERDATHYLLPVSLVALLAAHARLLARNPRRYLRGVRLALETRRAGLKGTLYQLFYLAEAGLLAAHLRRERADHLHAHFGDVSTSIAMLASALADVPYSFTLHGPGVFFEAHTWRLDAKIERAAFVSCISWFARSQAQYLSDEASAAKLHIVHCGVDPDRYTDRSSQTGRPGDPVTLAFVARIDHVKGVTLLVDAVADLRADGLDVRLDLAGDGPGRPAAEARVAERGLGDAVTFLGYVDQSGVADLLARADVYVLPSFAEGVPVGLMEAQASGLPVIATQVGGVTELVVDGTTGFVCPPGDTATLVDRIRRLATDPELRSRMGAAGRVRVAEEFSSAAEGRRLAALITAAGDTTALGPRPADPAA